MMEEKTYYFGSGYERAPWGDLWVCTAKDLEAAVNRFKIEVLFPEQYVDDECKEKDENGCVIKERDDITDRYIYKLKDNPIIHVTSVNPWIIFKYKKEYAARKDDPDPVLECDLTLAECINVNYTDILPKRFLLTGNTSEDGLTERDVTLPVIGNLRTLPGKNKLQLREMHDKIAAMRHDLELERDKLKHSMELLHAEIQQKMRGLYILETFLGVKEEIIQIAEGQNAPNELPLSIYQQLLYMDEEYGVCEDQGLDWQNIEDFDKWVVYNIDKFIYKQKGVAAFRVRRNDKTYAFGGGIEAALINVTMNEPNKYTYFVIRNGENIYRIFSNVSVSDRLFPTLTEYQKIVEEHKGSVEMFTKRPYAEVKVEQHHRRYMYGFVAIQGLIERTPIFPGMQGKTNLLVGNTTNIDLIRDDEKEFWLNDGRDNWQTFAQKNRDTICKGSRVVLTMDHYNYFDSYDRRLRFSGGNPGIYNAPKNGIFVVYDTKKENKEWRHSDYDFKVLYNPKDTIYSHYRDYGGHERKKRVGINCSLYEALNFDEMTIADCDYYMQNRNYRGNYLGMLPILAKVKEWKLYELEQETPLVNLILNKMGLDATYEIEVREAILWWKTKNKWKRNVMDNDNVVRMVTKKLERVLCGT